MLDDRTDGTPHERGEQLVELMYSELRFCAERLLRHERANHTLQPTALLHEAWMRLESNSTQNEWSSRGHFFAAAATAMRRVLIDHARAKTAIKRGGQMHRVVCHDFADVRESQQFLADLDDSLQKLATQDPQAAAIAMLHLTGHTVEAAAEIADTSRANAFRHWTYARAFLRAEFVSGSL
ncbi:ECF-type sigma factor [Roseimaritima ulvae]|uniref:ECF sigma factor n=1 Tax=Roseimaritima ulvae TaxID=980254 RepID=A0A5B9QGR8_9BACT|nr:ECF-type sigma factor [Roseimaritima ulvae]QEG38238.1 ECF sigma factor [Roseimaritima ulvae]